MTTRLKQNNLTVNITYGIIGKLLKVVKNKTVYT